MQGNRRFEKTIKWDASSGKVFAENNPTANNSGNDSIGNKNTGIDLFLRKIRDQRQNEL